MICTKKTVLLTLSLATTWSVNALALSTDSISKPPLKAYTACEGKQPGEQSSFVSELGNTISGLCEQQQDGRLILKPNNLIRSNAIPAEAYQECDGKKLGDTVQLTLPTGKTISGTCQSDGDRLFFRLDTPPGMDIGMHGGMKTHAEGQYQELQDESKQPDTRQQAPDQNENDSSDGNQQQQQQSDPTNSVEKPEEQASQPAQQPVQDPVQKHQEKPQEKPKGFLGKMKDFFTNLW